LKGIWRSDYRSWGGTLAARHFVVAPNTEVGVVETLKQREGLPVLAFGCGRSYGDVALNPDGIMVDCKRLDRFIALDNKEGVLACEGGVTLSAILAMLSRPVGKPNCWLLPVMPGTRFVTVAGAIANDVHGKNHHLHGTFGRHVLSFDLARGDGSVVTCSRKENAELFAATIGGLGLTGVILRVTIKLRRVESIGVEAEDIRFADLDGFFRLTEGSDTEWEYTAAWIDCSARGGKLGRGIFSRARHRAGSQVLAPRAPRLAVPASPPISLVNGLSVRAFNAAYWRLAGRRAAGPRLTSYQSVLFPLDALGAWNLLYGRRGFYQFQCAVPKETAPRALTEMMRSITASGQGSVLAVLKMFGEMSSPGLMSFPRPGATLAVDFANRGRATQQLLLRLEELTLEAGGHLYPAKDGAMTTAAFKAGYPNLDAYCHSLDPAFSSAFAKRVGIVPN
jgi:FAD/FMN-containing dehydrogenase